MNWIAIVKYDSYFRESRKQDGNEKAGKFPKWIIKLVSRMFAGTEGSPPWRQTLCYETYPKAVRFSTLWLRTKLATCNGTRKFSRFRNSHGEPVSAKTYTGNHKFPVKRSSLVRNYFYKFSYKINFSAIYKKDLKEKEKSFFTKLNNTRMSTKIFVG